MDRRFSDRRERIRELCNDGGEREKKEVEQ